ncbi:SH3 domain-containing protein [Arhodomonas sp. SL1]|uniref:SH3 domain-containing protein n=1 Tax=Arhodomonas sp. SL1 TaxID=3425691 RepID=UPI003F884622
MSRHALSLILATAVALPAISLAEERKASYAEPYLVESPGAGGERHRRLEAGEPVRVIGRDGRWVRVRTRNGESGWVRRSQLR